MSALEAKWNELASRVIKQYLTLCRAQIISLCNIKDWGFQDFSIAQLLHPSGFRRVGAFLLIKLNEWHLKKKYCPKQHQLRLGRWNKKQLPPQSYLYSISFLVASLFHQFKILFGILSNKMYTKICNGMSLYDPFAFLSPRVQGLHCGQVNWK